MYSRRLITEERKNKRKAFFFISLTIFSLFLIFFYGLPAVAKFAGFLTDLRQTSQSVESSDTTPPPPPRLSSIPKQTNKEILDIQGSSEPGASVKIFYNGKTDEVVVNSEGSFYISIPLNNGDNRISASSKDSAGNESQKSETLEITFDKKPPELEITKPHDKDEFFGNLQRQIVIEGKVEEGSQVNINSRLVVVEQDQTFAFVTSLSEGTNTFNIKAEDLAGNVTEKSISVAFTP